MVNRKSQAEKGKTASNFRQQHMKKKLERERDFPVDYVLSRSHFIYCEVSGRMLCRMESAEHVQSNGE